jgi:tRNA G18 (ribose-2'-O)-methylase SpoU
MNVTDVLKDKGTEEIKDIYVQTSVPDAVAALNISGDMNIGMCVRSASLFGISHFYVLGRRSYDKRTTVGQDHYIPIDRITASKGCHSDEFDIDKIVEILRGFQEERTIVYIEQGGRSVVNFRDTIADSKPVLFVVGNEGMGIPKEVMDTVSGIVVEIPQRGVGRSHNVSNALAIVLWEYYRITF